MNKNILSKLAFICAVCGALSVISFTVVGGLNFPNYNHFTQFISELGARNAPNEFLIRYVGFLVSGIFICLFTLFAYLALPKSRMTALAFLGIFYYSVGYIVAAFFPCDPGCRPSEPSASQLIHNLVGGTGYIVGALSLISLGVQARKWAKAKHLSSLGFVLGITALIAALMSSPTFTFAGLTQRITELSMLTWIIACAYYLNQNSVDST